MQSVFQFATFVMRDPELTPQAVPGLGALLQRWTDRVGAQVPVSAATFAHPDRVTFANSVAATQQAHVACFIEDLAIAEWYATHRRPADVVTSYSMGLYPALVHVGALSMADALRVMTGACAAAHAVAGVGPFAMLAVTDADAAALESLCTRLVPAVELTDRYAPDTQLFTGRLNEIVLLQDAAAAQGWHDTLLLPVSAPFHSTALRATRPAIAQLLADVSIASPQTPVRSSTAAEWITTADAVREEVLRNVWSPMNWAGTLQAIAAHGPCDFVECGASRRLSRAVQRVLGGAHAVRGLADDSLPHAP